jgi:pimeloyl-ACP methyl ester carboxylesterase
MSAEGTLILLPGMAADVRLFDRLRPLLPQLVASGWIEPRSREPIRSYARRLADGLNPRPPCFVGGVSFGGLVALELAAWLRADACFLISSVRSASELPPWLRVARPLAALGPQGLGDLAHFAAHWSAPLMPAGSARRLEHLAKAAFLRWASWAALRWSPSAAARRVRVFQIHGALDRTLPVRYTRPEVVVEGAGHLLPLSHPSVLGEFVLSRMVRLERSETRVGPP